jgi:hypothetical protein
MSKIAIPPSITLEMAKGFSLYTGALERRQPIDSRATP